MERRSYLCYRSPGPLEIDGNISKIEWRAAPWSEEFEDIEGDLKPKPPLRTKMKMLWDDQFLYVAAYLEEPHVWALLTERDSVVFLDNDFEVFIDPDGDNHHYVEFEINALGTVWDLLLPRPYKDGGMPLTGWCFKGMESAVQIGGTINDPSDTDQGWVVEAAIPWTGIKEICRCNCPPRDGDQWRMNFSRVEWDQEISNGKYRKIEGRPEHNWVWCPQGVVDMHRPELWGYVQFTAAAPGEAVFRQDYSAKARELLHRVYYAQREYRIRTGNWADSVGGLGIDAAVTIHTTPNYFEAVTVDRYPDGSEHDWHIGSDAYIWEGESYESKCVRGECEFRPDFGSESIQV